MTFISIIVPTYNEAGFVGAAVQSLLPIPEDFDYEILVVDGGSSDGTVAIVEALARDNPRIRLVFNPRRLQSAAVNLGVEVANPDAGIIVRADSHATYPPGFVERCVRTLQEKQVPSVVVTMDTVGVTCFQRGVAAAQNSLIGNGGSAHRRQGASRFVDHGHHAVFDRAFFQSLGGYDEAVKANEDVDYDNRVIKAGGQIWLETSVPVTYFPRDSVKSLARQYYNYGRGRALTYRRYGYALKARQLMPVAILGANLVGLLGGLLVHPIAFLIPLAYLALCLGIGVMEAVRRQDRCLVSLGVAAMVMHLAWAAGFIREFPQAGKTLTPVES